MYVCICDKDFRKPLSPINSVKQSSSLTQEHYKPSLTQGANLNICEHIKKKNIKVLPKQSPEFRKK